MVNTKDKVKIYAVTKERLTTESEKGLRCKYYLTVKLRKARKK